jgi:hypothetical protein
VILPFVALQPSRRERHWRRAGQSLAAAAALALVVASFRAGFDIVPLLLALVALVVAWRAGRLQGNAFEIGVADDGAVVVRTVASGASAATARPVHCPFAAPWLITLRHGTMLIPVWPDALPEPMYRRLWVHLRWARGVVRSDADKGTGDVERR